jgi:hypothetical protein
MKIVSQACSCIPLSNQHIGSFCFLFLFLLHSYNSLYDAGYSANQFLEYIWGSLEW